MLTGAIHIDRIVEGATGASRNQQEGQDMFASLPSAMIAVSASVLVAFIALAAWEGEQGAPSPSDDSESRAQLPLGEESGLAQRGSLRIEQRSQGFTCAPASSCVWQVSCEHDEQVSGGGYQLNDPDVGLLEVWGNSPDGNGWQVATINHEVTRAIRYKIWAMCATFVADE
jgi:hypothetical protein